MAGGRMLTASDGESYPVDHLYAEFQIPPGARPYPLVFVHGGSQAGTGWKMTPDGREGFESIVVRRGFATYTVDFPRRGRAGYPSFNGPFGQLDGVQIIPNETNKYSSEKRFITNRLGAVYPEYFANSQFPKSSFVHYARMAVPGVADDGEVVASALAALLDQIGPAILVTHSQSGAFGWLTGLRSSKVAAIYAYEPYFTFPFPEQETPAARTQFDGTLRSGSPVGLPEFHNLTRGPIEIVYADNIPAEPSPVAGLDMWRVAQAQAGEFVEALNRHGGRAGVVGLPDLGLHGNSHFCFIDLNNLEVADLLASWLSRHGLD